MATYIQGVTDYVPQVQPWRPNYNFYQPIFQQKQAKYDAGWDKVNNMYNSVLNAPMLREDNKLRRDDFFKNAQQQIQQLSGVDLSLEQNTDAAAQVFQPFYEDQGIVKDIGFTKKYQDEMQHAEYLRNCTDPEKCGDKYWSGGVRAMNYQAEDFINATAEEALSIAAPRYVNYYNLMKKGQEAVKDAGLSMKVDSRSGGMIVTTKNGSQLTMPLMNFMMARFGDDPALQDFYSTKALLLTKENPEAANSIYLKSMQNPQMSQEQVKQEAQTETLNNTYIESKKVLQGTATREENRFMNMVRKKDILTSDIRKNGVVPGSKEANAFLGAVKDANVQEGVVNKLNNMNTAALNTDEGLQRQGLTANANQMRGVIANAMKVQDMFNTANSLAYRDYERTMKVDPYAMEATRFSHQKQMANIKQGYTLQNKAYDYTYKKSLEEIKNSYKIGAVGTSTQFYSRPDNNYFNRLNYFQQTGDATGQPAPVGTDGDKLAAYILSGMSNPMSYVSTEPDMIASLVEQGRYKEAAVIAQGNTGGGTIPMFEPGTGVLLSKPPKSLTPPDISYDINAAKAGVNIMTATGDRFAKLRSKANNDWNPFTTVGGIEHDAASISKMKSGFNDWRSYAAGRVNEWKQSAEGQKNKINTDILTTQFSIAGNDANPEEAAKMQIEMLDLTTKIDSNFKYWGKRLKKQFHGDISNDYQAYKRAADSGWGNIPNLTAEQFKVMRWGLPTNTERSWAANSEQFRKIKNVGLDKIIALAGGDKELYKFNEEAGGQWIPSDENSGKYIDIKSANIMDHNEYAKYQTLRNDEAGNLNEDGTYVNPQLSPEVIERLDKYEKYNSQTEFERKWGAGSTIPTIQMLNDIQAETKIGIAHADDASQNAIDKFNIGLDNALDKLTPQTQSIDGQIWNAIKDKLVIKGGEGELSKIATKAQLNNILAEALPELTRDGSWFQDHEPFVGFWGDNLYDFKLNKMNDGKTSKQSMLNMLSYSNYASKSGAKTKTGLIQNTYSHPSYKETAAGYNQAIAGWKMNEDSKLPIDKRKYKNIGEALAETKNENPYTKGISNFVYMKQGHDTESFDVSSQEFLQFIGKYDKALISEYKRGGTEYRITPDYTWYDRHKNQSDPSASSMSTLSFDLKSAKMDKGFVNIFNDHQATIGTAYEELLNNFTNEASSFGGMFADDKGVPRGQGAITAIPTTLNAVSPMKQDQNYWDSREIIDEAILNGNFSALGEDVTITGKELLTQLSAALKNPTFNKKETPLWDLKQTGFEGDYNSAQYTLTLLEPDWLKSQGYNKAKGGTGGIVEGTKAPTSYTWTVKNPKNALAQGIHPTEWDATVGNLGIGETYTNTALSKQYGNIHYSKTDKGEIQAGYTVDLFNPETGEEEEITFYAPALNYMGNDWTANQLNLVQEMINTKKLSEDTKKRYNMIRGTRDTDELLQGMADQLGISVEELTQQFK